MEKQTLHRAADTLNVLLKAHVSDDAESIDVHDVIAIRDDIRELAYQHDQDWELPEVGDVVHDKDHNPKFGNGDVRVTEVFPSTEAQTFYIDVPTGKRSVAYKNPDRSPNAPIVQGMYVDGSDKVYAFPVDRLDF